VVWQSVVSGLSAGSGYALMAIGFGLIFEVCNFYHLSHGAVFALGAYLSFLFGVVIGWNPGVAIVLSIIGSATLGAGMECMVYRPLRRTRASSLVLLIVSLGILIVVQNVISLTFGDSTKTLTTGPVREGLDFFGARITSVQVLTIILSIVASSCLWGLLRYTKPGIMTRAVAADFELSLIVGVSRDRVLLGTFAVGSALAGVAGILVGYDVGITPTMGFRAILMGVVAAIVGGIGSVPGAFLGGLFIGLVQHLGVLKLPTAWQDAIIFVILILFLVFRPQGFLGSRGARVAS
jgi:branched-chain amino acid transport system permease protein